MQVTLFAGPSCVLIAEGNGDNIAIEFYIMYLGIIYCLHYDHYHMMYSLVCA